MLVKMVRPEVFVIFVAVLTHPGPGVLAELLQVFLIPGFPSFKFLVNTGTEPGAGNVWIAAVVRQTGI